ncbi:MAG: hypothetical protein PSX81_06855 [bacterium]|nr:hypothetical protein [bacterium]
MKKLIYSTLGLMITASMILMGCGGGSGGGGSTPETPKPTITFLNTAGYISTNVSRLNTGATANLLFGMVVTSTIDLKSITVTRNYEGSGEVVILTKNVPSNSKNFQIDVMDTLNAALKGKYVYSFKATDNDATTNSNSLEITATGALLEVADQKIYNNFGTGFGGYDLINGENISNADASNVARRDIRDNSSSSVISKSWTSSNGTTFIKDPPTITWDQMDSEAKLKSAFDLNAGSASANVTGLDGVTGTLILAKVTRASSTRYFMIRVTGIVDAAGANGDYVLFDYKF